MISPGSTILTVLCLILLAGASGCMTRFSVKMDSWIGRPMQQWLDIPDKGREYVEEIRGPDENGNKVYVIHVERKCRLFRTVNAQGIITGWSSEGSACKHYWN